MTIEDYKNPFLRFLLSKNEFESKGHKLDCDFVWKAEDFFASRGCDEKDFTAILGFLRWAWKKNYAVGLEKTDRASQQLLRSLFRQEAREPVPFKDVAILMPWDMDNKVVGVYIASDIPTELPFRRAHDWTLRDIHSSMFIGSGASHWNNTVQDWDRLVAPNLADAGPMPR
ncbi:MAG TPA: hypothetical protein DEA55_01570 [Rhodospirillaceae bacterium]|nr:hypothetical protein [Rhodospirillaceae bacterium]